MTEYCFNIPATVRIRVVAQSEEEARAILATAAEVVYVEHETEVGDPDTGHGRVYVAWLESNGGTATRVR